MPTPDAAGRILIRGVNWIGDAVMTMPAIRSVRLAFPAAHISLLVKPWVAPLFEKDPCVDEIILYREEHAGIGGKFRLAAELRKRAFDRAILLQNAFDAAATAFLGGIRERIGYSRDGRGFLLTRAVPFADQDRRVHHTEYYLSLLGKAGIPPRRSIPWIWLSLEERLAGRARLLGLQRPVVALNPGATYGSSKRWQPERFAEVAERVIGEAGGSVVILGGRSEATIAAEISGKLLRHAASRVLSVAGQTGLRELAGLLSACDALVTNDSGPMHIGYAVGTPVVAVFGSTSAAETGPLGPRDVVVSAGLDCAPCFERECPTKDLRCMDLVSPERVFDALKPLLPKQRAVFFDRDGTLCRDAHYLSRMEDFEIFPGIAALAELKGAGFLLIGITNQSGIGRGLVSEEFVRQVNGIFVQSHGFDGFYFCPHHPEDRCSCRKPEPGMLVQARAEHSIDLRRSFVVGDTDADMQLARAVGATGILVRTGQSPDSRLAEHVVADLPAAVKLVRELA
ncbi:MAG: lipopolysaccharide heptosyltransferase II [Thermodesulfovibrionales bacterium]